jgi:hypothetical protein
MPDKEIPHGIENWIAKVQKSMLLISPFHYFTISQFHYFAISLFRHFTISPFYFSFAQNIYRCL